MRLRWLWLVLSCVFAGRRPTHRWSACVDGKVPSSSHGAPLSSTVRSQARLLLMVVVTSGLAAGCISHVSSARISSARQKWSTVAVSDYSFTLTIGSFSFDPNCAIHGEIEV